MINAYMIMHAHKQACMYASAHTHTHEPMHTCTHVHTLPIQVSLTLFQR